MGEMIHTGRNVNTETMRLCISINQRKKLIFAFLLYGNYFPHSFLQCCLDLPMVGVVAIYLIYLSVLCTEAPFDFDSRGMNIVG